MSVKEKAIAELQALAKDICKNSKTPILSGIKGRIEIIKKVAAEGGAKTTSPKVKKLFNQIHGATFELERALASKLFDRTDEYFDDIHHWGLEILVALQ